MCKANVILDKYGIAPLASPAKMSLSSATVFKKAQGFALVVMIAAYLGQQAPGVSTVRLTFLWHGFSERSVLNGTWVVVYVMLVRVLLWHPVGMLIDWLKELRDSTNTAMTRVSSSETISRIRSSVSMSSARLFSLAGCRSSGRNMLISAKEPFLSRDDIAQLTLGDLKDMFRYALELGQSTFDRREFVAELRRPAAIAIDAIDRVTAASGGGAYLPTSLTDDNTDVDALHFAAAVRIFAEWRSLRLVPKDSNPRYSFGMEMARRDLVQNVGKIEVAVHDWLSRSQLEPSTLTSPTVRQLLQIELQCRVHNRLPQLYDQSGASGVLWAKRQLSYQTAIFRNMLQIPYTFPKGTAAVQAAYKATYDNYHGFFVKQMFQSSFQAAPEAEVVLRCMDEPELQGSLFLDGDDPTMLEADEDDVEDSWVHIPMESGRSAQLAFKIGPEPEPNVLDHIWGYILGEWEKMQTLVGQCAGIQATTHPSRNVMHASDGMTVQDPRNPGRSIPSFLHVMEPFLRDLDLLVKEYNMNDPTRV